VEGLGWELTILHPSEINAAPPNPASFNKSLLDIASPLLSTRFSKLFGAILLCKIIICF
jgi:hypothetical protein